MSARTFDTDKICWFDFESRSGVDLQKVGAMRYACDRDAAAIILTYAIGHSPTKLILAPEPGAPLSWHHLPLDFTEFYYRVEASAAADVHSVFWFDGRALIGKLAVSEGALPWRPSADGAHLIRVIDDHGRAAERDVQVQFTP